MIGEMLGTPSIGASMLRNPSINAVVLPFSTRAFDHNSLLNRNAFDAHPISAIAGLDEALDDRYTIGEADALLADKQKKLTAGANIHIRDDGTIEATGEYSTIWGLLAGNIDDQTDLKEKFADVEGLVTAEETVRIAAVSAETTARENADTALGAAVSAETTARENADTALGAAICGLGNAIGMRGWNQLVLNGNFADTTGWSVYRCTLSVSGNVCRATCSTDGGIYVYRQNVVSEYIDGHKYFSSAHIKSSATKEFLIATGTSVSTKVSLTDIIKCQSGVWTEISGIKTMNKEGHNGNSFAPQSNSPLSVGDYVDIKNTMLIDLTALFGSGNEPSTVSEFKAMFPVDYYPYCSGSFADLLWTNPNPSSAFSAQAIQVDLTNYKFVMVCFSPSNNQEVIGRTFGGQVFPVDGQMHYATAGQSSFMWRALTILQTQISFTNARNNTSFGSDTQDSSVLIPYQVYGIR